MKGNLDDNVGKTSSSWALRCNLDDWICQSKPEQQNKRWNHFQIIEILNLKMGIFLKIRVDGVLAPMLRFWPILTDSSMVSIFEYPISLKKL